MAVFFGRTVPRGEALRVDVGEEMGASAVLHLSNAVMHVPPAAPKQTWELHAEVAEGTSTILCLLGSGTPATSRQSSVNICFGGVPVKFSVKGGQGEGEVHLSGFFTNIDAGGAAVPPPGARAASPSPSPSPSTADAAPVPADAAPNTSAGKKWASSGWAQPVPADSEDEGEAVVPPQHSASKRKQSTDAQDAPAGAGGGKQKKRKKNKKKFKATPAHQNM